MNQQLDLKAVLLSKPVLNMLLAISIRVFKINVPGKHAQIAFGISMALNWLLLEMMLRATRSSADGSEFTVKELDAYHEKGCILCLSLFSTQSFISLRNYFVDPGMALLASIPRVITSL
jgi:hypothetical protein